jgi:shikimate kinase
VHLLLIGPRASGKTTIGRLVAAATDRPFVDLDVVVLASFDEPTVESVWQAHGEPAWRAGEVDALRSVLSGADAVVALGGGTPMIPEARALIDDARQHGTARVCYLRVPVAVLVERLEADPGDRPSLTGAGVAEEMAAVLAVREPTYLAVADEVVEAHEDSADVAAVIIDRCG